jgi:hypothetical protein
VNELAAACRRSVTDIALHPMSKMRRRPTLSEMGPITRAKMPSITA